MVSKSRLNRSHEYDTERLNAGMRLMSEKKLEWVAREREEIAARVAHFRATQKKFEKEREEYYAATLSNAWDGFNKPFAWN
jgi:hypothetical protein